MAKRKRLAPAPFSGGAAAPEPAPAATRAPIAQVAGDASTRAALDALAGEMHAARRDGRLVQALPLELISEDHMVRDRMVSDPAEMESLKASLVARGQQTPIEVVELPDGHYGLISGWRRLHALRALLAETSEARFAQIEALIKPIDSVSDGYIAMVEENEIRTNLSFYERARLACEAARLGVFPTPAKAVRALFANASAPKRSKISSFVKLHEALGAALRFPTAIPERLGLALVAAMEADAGFAPRLRDILRKGAFADAGAERAALERALRRTASEADGKADTGPQRISDDLALSTHRGGLLLTGKGVTPELRAALVDWLSQR